jgi:hypothetical protein
MSKNNRYKLIFLIFLSFIFITPQVKASFLEKIINTAPEIIQKRINKTIEKEQNKKEDNKKEDKCISSESCSHTIPTDESTAEKEQDLLAISNIDKKQVTLNKGSEVGLKEGMLLNINRIVRQVKEPETGKVLKIVTEKVGKIRITRVTKKSSIGEIITGNSLRIGDIVQLE